jgi:hypothetical protein
VEISQDYQINVRENGKDMENIQCTVMLSDGSKEEVKTGENGQIELEMKVPGVALWIEYKDVEGNIRRLEAMHEHGDF